MFEFEQKSQLFLEQKNLTFRHNRFQDLSEFVSFSKEFPGEMFHLGNKIFECYASQILTDNMQLNLFQHNSPLLYRGACLKSFTFTLSAFHYGTLYSHQYKIDTNMITIVYPHQEIAAFRQKLQGDYVIFFEDKFLNNLCETLELFELKKN